MKYIRFKEVTILFEKHYQHQDMVEAMGRTKDDVVSAAHCVLLPSGKFKTFGESITLMMGPNEADAKHLDKIFSPASAF